MRNTFEYISAAIPFSITQVVHLLAIHPFLSLSLFLFVNPSTLRVRLSRLCVTILPASRHRAIKIGCHYSLTQFFFNLPRPPYYASYLLTYLSTYPHQFSKPLRARRRLVQFFRRVFTVRFPRVRLYSPSHSVADTFLGKGIHANFNLFGYALLAEHDEGKALFDDDDCEINETIGLRVTFKSHYFDISPR